MMIAVIKGACAPSQSHRTLPALRPGTVLMQREGRMGVAHREDATIPGFHNILPDSEPHMRSISHGCWPQVICVLVISLLVLGHAGESAGYVGPSALVASRDGRWLCVAEADQHRISLVDVATGKRAHSIAVPGEPTGLAISPDGQILYASCAATVSTICGIDLGSAQMVFTATAGHSSSALAITPDGKQLYVCNLHQDDVSLIDIPLRREIARIRAVREPCAIALTPDGSVALVANLVAVGAYPGRMAAEITLFDTANRQRSRIELPNGSSSVRGICVSPDGRFGYAVHVLGRFNLPTTTLDRGWMNTNALSIIDVAQRKRIATVLLDDVNRGAANPWGVTTSANGGKIIISHSGTHELSIIDTEAMQAKLSHVQGTAGDKEVSDDLMFMTGIRKRIALSGHGPRGIAVIGDRIYAASYFSDAIEIVELKTKEPGLAGWIALGPKPMLTQQRRGQFLFADASICFQGWQSCTSCHPNSRVDGLTWDLLNDGIGNPKRTRNLVGAHAQRHPVMAMGIRGSAEVAVRAGIRYILYAVRPEEEAVAIDEYLRSLQPVPSPFLVAGQPSPAAARGRQLFEGERLDCASCHRGPWRTDGKLHDVQSRGAFDKPTDRFQTPRLIELWRNAPYFHDGRYQTLEEVLTKGNHGLGTVQPPLSQAELGDLLAFLRSL